MAYVRKNAVNFADNHWNTPSDDGLFWLSNQAVVIASVRTSNVIPNASWKKAPVADGWQPFFVDDSLGGEKAVFRRGIGSAMEEILINPWAGIADCAHFLSRCLTAGGLKIAERGVPQLVDTLQSLSNTKTLCERVNQAAGQRVVDSGVFKPGDMVGYFNIDPKGDYGGAKQYSHSAMYAGKINGNKDGGITCHTICRFPGRSWVEDSWWLKPPGHYTYTLIHFSDDDSAPDAATVSALAGWWKVDSTAKTDFYLVTRNGTAPNTKQAHESGQTANHLREDTAYWFTAPHSQIIFTWRKSGNIDVWSPLSSGFSGKVNGATPATLTKL
jgi:hypothetical protein